MQYTSAILLAAFAVTHVTAHGVVTEVTGANGVVMPGLSVIDGTPRDCATPGCGSEADTSVIRDNEIGTAKASALGRTSGGGPVDPSVNMAIFMDGAAGNTTAAKAAREIHFAKRQLKGLLGGGAAGGAAKGTDAAGVKTQAGTSETGVAASTGAGASSGLPTCSDSGAVTMTIHQVNQDGAGPFAAMVDPTSGGTDPTAFKAATMTSNVPGIVAGLSATSTSDFQVTMQMPAGMVCSGQVGASSNVCVAKLQNATPAGPFGGSVAFTQSTAAKKRAIIFNIRKRNFSRMMKRHLTDAELEQLSTASDEEER